MLYETHNLNFQTILKINEKTEVLYTWNVIKWLLPVLTHMDSITELQFILLNYSLCGTNCHSPSDLTSKVHSMTRANITREETLFFRVLIIRCNSPSLFLKVEYLLACSNCASLREINKAILDNPVK